MHCPLASPHPARACGRRVPVCPLRSPQVGTRTPLRQPPPHPRLRRSSPAPTRGRGQCWRYPGESRARNGADAGFSGDREEPARTRFFPGISPWSGPWWISPRGWGSGRGFRLPAGDTHTLLRHPPPRPRLRRSSPAPRRGRGSHGDIRGKAVPGMVLTPVSRETEKSQPGPGSSPGGEPWWLSPREVGAVRGDIRG